MSPASFSDWPIDDVTELYHFQQKKKWNTFTLRGEVAGLSGNRGGWGADTMDRGLRGGIARSGTSSTVASWSRCTSVSYHKEQCRQ